LRALKSAAKNALAMAAKSLSKPLGISQFALGLSLIIYDGSFLDYCKRFGIGVGCSSSLFLSIGASLFPIIPARFLSVFSFAANALTYASFLNRFIT